MGTPIYPSIYKITQPASMKCLLAVVGEGEAPSQLSRSVDTEHNPVAECSFSKAYRYNFWVIMHSESLLSILCITQLSTVGQTRNFIGNTMAAA